MDEEIKQQEARAFLREKFLKTLTELVGQKCTMVMHENTKVTCKAKAFDPDFENVIVEDLKTPLPQSIPTAILRTSDIISMKFEIPQDAT